MDEDIEQTADSDPQEAPGRGGAGATLSQAGPRTEVVQSGPRPGALGPPSRS